MSAAAQTQTAAQIPPGALALPVPTPQHPSPLRRLLGRLLGWVYTLLAAIFTLDSPPSILHSPARPRPRYSPTSSLIIIHTDHPVDAVQLEKLDAALEPLRQKYGLDFLIQEPGFKFTRFDDI